MANVLGIHHAALVTPDLDAAITFYCRALQFERVKRSAWKAPAESFDRLVGLQGSSAEFCLLQSGNAYLELFSYASTREQPTPQIRADQPGIRHLALQVDDIPGVLGWVLECGGSQVGDLVRISGGGGAVYCRDPFGNIIELVEPAGAMPPIRTNTNKGEDNESG